jgi:predicted ATPase/Tfp pilus assembly protein PilF
MTGSSNHRTDRFVGRKRELTALGTWFADGERLVTIVGPPGIGKTRLAVEYLRTLDSTEASPFGWHRFCDLSEAKEAKDVWTTVENALGLAPRRRKAGSAPSATLGPALKARGPGLLVLDNVEQIGDAIATSVLDGLHCLPELSILFTSRERLRAAGETCLDLGPLELPCGASPGESDALTLFADRARHHEPSFEVTRDNEHAVTDLLRALDGIPLAIELAAARVSVMHAEELRQRISEGIDCLSRGTRSAPSRQATLRSAVKWSWDLLSGLERDVLSRCSVFRGGFTLAAAEAVFGDASASQSVLDTLHGLRDKSMLRVIKEAEETRFNLFFGVREFAAEQLASSGREADIRRVHAETYLAFASAVRADLERSGNSEKIRALVREHDNLIAAHEYLTAPDSYATAEQILGSIIALEPVLLTRGPIEELLDLVDCFMERSDVVSIRSSMRARALHARAGALQLSGTLDAAEAAYDAAIDALAEDGDVWQRAALLVDAGVLQHRRRRLERAHALYAEALALYESHGSVRQQARVLGDMGAVHHDRREFQVAEEYYRRALLLLRRAEDTRLEGNLLANLGLLAAEQGRFEAAEASLTRAETALELAADRRLLGIVRGNMGALALERGELEKARERLLAAIRELSEFGDLSSQALCLARHAAVEAALSASSEWRAHSFAAERLLDADDDPLMLMAVRLYAALAELSSGSPSADELRQVRELVASACKPSTDGGTSLADLSDDVRAALRLLDKQLLIAEPLAETLREAPEEALVVGPEGTWFRAPGGVSQSLGSHGPVRRILLALASLPAREAESGLAVEALREIGWPGEKMQPEAAANRVHVALAELRRRGLKRFILRRANGYALSETLPIHRSDTPFPERS